MHTVHLRRGDAFLVTANIVIFSLIYAVAGAVLSFIFYYTFDVYDPENHEGREWEHKGMLFQIADIVIEVITSIPAHPSFPFAVAWNISLIPIHPVSSSSLPSSFLWTIFHTN
jgi:hypothetical protein